MLKANTQKSKKTLKLFLGAIGASMISSKANAAL